VIDEFVRQERVQHHFHRWIWRRRIDQAGALDADKVRILNVIERAQLAHRGKPHGGQAAGIYARHIGAGGLYPENLDIFAEAIAHPLLERRVAAAVQNELWIAAEEPRRVDPQRQVAVDARLGGNRFRKLGDHALGVGVDPGAFHGALNRRRFAATTSRSGAVDWRFRFRRLQ
jgi:hypothetical protein